MTLWDWTGSWCVSVAPTISLGVGGMHITIILKNWITIIAAEEGLLLGLYNFLKLERVRVLYYDNKICIGQCASRISSGSTRVLPQSISAQRLVRKSINGQRGWLPKVF
jgi:hypothetical protein